MWYMGTCFTGRFPQLLSKIRRKTLKSWTVVKARRDDSLTDIGADLDD
jgi:hypothetical protein